MDHTKSWLKYVDASDVRGATLDLARLQVKNGSREELGTVDGLIVEAGSGRPYYVVVKAEGWFTSKYFLVPIGQLHVVPEGDGLLVFLTKDQIARFPGFDRGKFEELTDQDLARLNDSIMAVCEPEASDAGSGRDGDPFAWPSYRVPDWWGTGSPVPSKARVEAAPVGGPHFDGRAQPGDVIGIETGGERTGIGDTKADEQERRQRAREEAARP